MPQRSMYVRLRSSTQAAIIAIIATKLSSSMEPYPTGQACDSLAIILGVVPDEISE